MTSLHAVDEGYGLRARGGEGHRVASDYDYVRRNANSPPYTSRRRRPSMSVVVSVRVPKHLKEKLERYGVDVPELIRSKLVEEVERIEREELRRLLDELKSRLQGKVDPYELSKLVEEERGER